MSNLREEQEQGGTRPWCVAHPVGSSPSLGCSIWECLVMVRGLPSSQESLGRLAASADAAPDSPPEQMGCGALCMVSGKP